MNRLAATLTACALLAVFALTATLAQSDDTPEADGLYRGYHPDVQLTDLVAKYSDETGRTVLYQPQQVRHTVTLVAPSKGAEHSAHSVLQTALSQFRMVMIDRGGVDVIVPAVEALRESTPVLDDEGLAEADPMTFASMIVRLSHVDANNAMGLLRNFVTQQGGTIQPVKLHEGDRGTLLIVDYVHNLRKIAAMIRELDRPSDRAVFRLEVMHADLSEVGNALAKVMGPADVRVARVSSARSLVLSGPPEAVRRAVQLANELDQAAAPTEE
jgi:type II secretory pathway component GspD/PulD (secretin)